MSLTPPDTDPVDPAGGNVTRRTVVTAAVWTAPVIATAIAAPLAAASGSANPTLAFMTGPTGVGSCAAFAALVLRATLDGTQAAANESITVALPVGLAFTDNTTTKTLSTAPEGTVTLHLKASAVAGKFPVNATWSARGLTASISLEVTSTVASATAFDANGAVKAGPLTGIPSSAVAVGGSYFSDGTLAYTPYGPTKPVGPHSVGYAIGVDYLLDYLAGDARVATLRNGVVLATYKNGRPRPITLLGYGYSLSGGDLWFQNTQMATGVTEAVAMLNSSTSGEECVYISNGQPHRAKKATVISPIAGGQPGAPKLVGMGLWLDGQTLYYGGNSPVSTTVTSVSPVYLGNASCQVWYTDATGGHVTDHSGIAWGVLDGLPTSVTKAVGAGYFLDGGDLWFVGADPDHPVKAQLVDTGVISAAIYRSDLGRISYTKGVC